VDTKISKIEYDNTDGGTDDEREKKTYTAEFKREEVLLEDEV
jgi:hypothetical protein